MRWEDVSRDGIWSDFQCVWRLGAAEFQRGAIDVSSYLPLLLEGENTTSMAKIAVARLHAQGFKLPRRAVKARISQIEKEIAQRQWPDDDDRDGVMMFLMSLNDEIDIFEMNQLYFELAFCQQLLLAPSVARSSLLFKKKGETGFLAP